MMSTNHDDIEQPLTIGEWLIRKRQEFQLLRASVHTQLDALLDREEAKMEQEVEQSLRELHVEHPTQQ